MCEPWLDLKTTVKKNSSNLNFGYLIFKDLLFLGVLMEFFML